VLGDVCYTQGPTATQSAGYRPHLVERHDAPRRLVRVVPSISAYA
jgi:hypothetical protein